jgi:hypothetical protein
MAVVAISLCVAAMGAESKRGWRGRAESEGMAAVAVSRV